MKIEDRTKKAERPVFPKKALITAGMPYGNKELHFGHIGGVFVHADVFTRFLKDRIGNENVIFVSGTDCYGSPIVEQYRQMVSENRFNGTIEDFVRINHEKQKEVLRSYHIDLSLFAASGFGKAKEIHKEESDFFITELYRNGHLIKVETPQFYDHEHEVFLNGRQVVGKCPIEGCSSETAYADECSLGHQYMPKELINPKSTLSGKRPEMKNVVNWYFKLDKFHDLLGDWIKTLEDSPTGREFMIKSIKEFMEPPVIFVKNDQAGQLAGIRGRLPEHKYSHESEKRPIILIFEKLEDREQACIVLTAENIRYRTGKTLVPFRLTGNIEWGIPAPSLEGLDDLTVWVWPESLWAPVSFTKAYLKEKGIDTEAWKEWWCSKDAKVYQFIGEDNIYFYGPVEMAIFMGMQGKDPVSGPKEGMLQLPELIANKHILFLDKKASSSGKVKPPMAGRLLDFYTAEQLRAHFMGLGLAFKSVGFKPKPLNPNAQEKEGDPVLKEGNLLSNVFNRAARSCFYSAQNYYDSQIPVGSISTDILKGSESLILDYEKLMYRYEFHAVINLMDSYIRNMNKYWAKNMREADLENNEELRKTTLIDTFHMVRTAAVLMHPVAPAGTELILDYLNLGREFWSWDRIFDSLYDFMDDPAGHKLKFLPPRFDFFEKHPYQIAQFKDKGK